MLSVGNLVKNGLEVLFSGNQAYLYKDGKSSLVANAENGLYYLTPGDCLDVDKLSAAPQIVHPTVATAIKQSKTTR
ncbi:hypothetical protein IWW45_008371, partial [Coemansia sp. RSA 485]